MAWYTFDESEGTIARDSAGGHNGVVHGAIWAEGKIGGALDFDGVSDYVSVPDSPELNITGDLTIPQIRGMYAGDRARKDTLVDYGFRLPSCLDNRPLKFNEFNRLVKQVVFVSATPDEYELTLSANKVIEQIIRPTGLIDPEIIVKPTQGQIEEGR